MSRDEAGSMRSAAITAGNGYYVSTAFWIQMPIQNRNFWEKRGESHEN